MFDPALFALACLHALALGGFWAGMALRVWRLPWRDGVLVVPLLFWATLALTAQAASLGSWLGSLPVYTALSFLCAGLLAFLLDKSCGKTLRPPMIEEPLFSFAPLARTRGQRRLLWIFLGGTLGLFALISFVLGLSVYPDNADSMIYRLPRAFWYVSNGNFLHPFEDTIDQRLVFYPLGGVSLYIPFVLYALPGTAHVLPSLLAWTGLLYLAYRFARALGAERLLAFLAAWLVALTPGILAQATSTNDEILAASALVACLYFSWQALRTGRMLYLPLAGMALALSAGTKLHIVFLLPLWGIALFLWALKSRDLRTVLRKGSAFLDLRALLATLLLIALLFTPFLIYNYLSVGRLYFFDSFKGDVFNLSADWRVGFQNLVIYLSQMVFSPLADLNVWPVADDRQAFNAALNTVFAPAVRALLSDDPSFYHLGYRFQGITLPVSVRFVEFSLWSGFVWMLWPFQVRGAIKNEGLPLAPLFLLTALTPFLWLVLWSCSTLYMEGTATYYTFYLICAAPAAALAFTKIERKNLNRLRWGALLFVALTNLVIAHNLVMFSGFRALPDLYYGRSWPYDWLLTEKPIIDELRAAKTIRIAFTHEKMPYFGYMHWNPRARYLSPYMIAPNDLPKNLQDVLQILPISSLSLYGYMPLKIEGKKTVGVTYLGAVRAIGREVIFASGAGVHLRHPMESDYIVGHATLSKEPEGTTKITYSSDVAGLNEQDGLLFEHKIEKDDGTSLFQRAASSRPDFEAWLKEDPEKATLILTTKVFHAETGALASEASYRLGAGSAWLPDPGDY